MNRRRAAWCGMLMIGAAASAPAGCSMPTLLGKHHYELSCPADERAEFSRLLEQQYRELDQFFGREPQEPLPVRVFANQREYDAALDADQLIVPSSGGYYSPTNHVAYLFHQPSTYYTRQLLLHEATHQFQYLAATGNERPTGGDWYVEGLAEYFAIHHWDGRKLIGGAIPTISLEDYPARAMAQLTRAGWNLRGIIAGHVQVERPAGWAIVHWLLDTRREKAKRLFAALDQQEDAAEAWEREVGGDYAAQSRELQQWVRAHPQPWQQVWTAWDERGGDLLGGSDVMGVAVLKREVSRMTADVRVERGGGPAGVVTGFKSSQDFWVFEVLTEARKLRRVHFVAGKVRDVMLYPIARSSKAGRCRIELRREGAEAVVAVDGRAVTRAAAAGRWGVSVNACRARFTVTSDPPWAVGP